MELNHRHVIANHKVFFSSSFDIKGTVKVSTRLTGKFNAVFLQLSFSHACDFQRRDCSFERVRTFLLLNLCSPVKCFSCPSFWCVWAELGALAHLQRHISYLSHEGHSQLSIFCLSQLSLVSLSAFSFCLLICRSLLTFFRRDHNKVVNADASKFQNRKHGEVRCFAWCQVAEYSSLEEVEGIHFEKHDTLAYLLKPLKAVSWLTTVSYSFSA